MNVGESLGLHQIAAFRVFQFRSYRRFQAFLMRSYHLSLVAWLGSLFFVLVIR